FDLGRPGGDRLGRSRCDLGHDTDENYLAMLNISTIYGPADGGLRQSSPLACLALRMVSLRARRACRRSFASRWRWRCSWVSAITGGTGLGFPPGSRAT